MNDSDEIQRIEASLKDLDLDYMRGLVSEEEYNTKSTELRTQLEQIGGTPSGLSAVETARSTLKPPPVESKKVMTDPVTAVKQTLQKMRRIPIERVAQESGVSAPEIARIINDLLDGRELSGRIDHDAGDFILGTGTGPPPKTIATCPYCRADLNRIAVKVKL